MNRTAIHGAWACALMVLVVPCFTWAADVYVQGLAPNWDQPNDYPDSYDPTGPGGPSAWDAWCTPTAAAMMMGHWADVRGAPTTGDGCPEGNQAAVRPWCALNWGAAGWHDYTAQGSGTRPAPGGPRPGVGLATDIGWYMNTNNLGDASLTVNPGVSHVGTYVGNAAEGLNNFLTDRGSPLAGRAATTYVSGTPTGCVLGLLQGEIDASRTVLGHFKWWVDPSTGPPGPGQGDGSEDSEAEFGGSGGSGDYQFWPSNPYSGPHEEQWNGEEGPGGLGHTVCVVGYTTGTSGSVTHLIVHDNWPATVRNVRVPVAGTVLNAFTTLAPLPAILLWDNGAGTNDWFTDLNWDPDDTPDPFDVLTVAAGAPVASITVTISQGGAVIVTGTSASASFPILRVGGCGAGALSVRNGATVAVSADASIGRYAGAHGTVTVRGPGSHWSIGTDLYVGREGAGEMQILDGGAVSDDLGRIGHAAAAHGTVTVQGAGSSWTNRSNLYVGEAGGGVLTVRDGGSVVSSYGYIGYHAGAAGSVTVEGAGSSWDLGNTFLCVGDNGAGSLHVRQGGVVSDTYGYLGTQSGSQGAAIVEGAGSEWINRFDMLVGYVGSGTLGIHHGGAVSCRAGYVGQHVAGRGTVLVTGTGSSWTMSENLYVGDRGCGGLEIANGAAVSDAGEASIEQEIKIDAKHWGFVGYWYRLGEDKGKRLTMRFQDEPIYFR